MVKIKITNLLKLPSQFVRCLNDNYSYKDKRYSITNIIGASREMMLKRRFNTHEEYTMDVADSVNLLIGNSIHSMLENIPLEEGELVEKHYTAPFIVNGFIYTLSGILDYINTVDEINVDYKTTAVYGVIYKSNYDKWQKQLEYGSYLHWVNTGQWIGNGQIICVIKDWKANDKLRNPDYPACPIVTVDFKLRDLREIRQELQEKFNEIHDLEKMANDNLPLCSLEDRWNRGNGYAVMKGKAKRALKVHDNEDDAKQHATAMNFRDDKNKYTVDVRLGSDTKCLKYCGVNKFCEYYKKTYGGTE